MGGTIHFNGLWPDWDGFDPSRRSLSYMRLQLWRRGFRGRERLAEGLDLALHHLMIEVGIGDEAIPTDKRDWRDWRRILDRAVYRAMRELCSCGSAGVDIDSLAGCLPTNRGAEHADRINSLSRAVAALPVCKRLLLYLKLADAYLPDWESRGIVWTTEEKGVSAEQAPGPIDRGRHGRAPLSSGGHSPAPSGQGPLGGDCLALGPGECRRGRHGLP